MRLCALLLKFSWKRIIPLFFILSAHINAADTFQTPPIPVNFRACIDTYNGFEASVNGLQQYTDNTVTLMNSAKGPFQNGLSEASGEGDHMRDYSTSLSAAKLRELGGESKIDFDKAIGLSVEAQLQFASAIS